MGVKVHTVSVSICKKCDAGVDPLEVPEEPCGCEYEENAGFAAVDYVPKRDFDTLLKLYEGTCNEAMELLKDAPGAACMFDPEYGLIHAGLVDSEA